MTGTTSSGDRPPLVNRLRKPRKKSAVVSTIAAVAVAAGGITGGILATQSSGPQSGAAS